jgi:hypothetical protein
MSEAKVRRQCTHALLLVSKAFEGASKNIFQIPSEYTMLSFLSRLQVFGLSAYLSCG